MLRTKRPKLALNGETIKHLTTDQLVNVGGGTNARTNCICDTIVQICAPSRASDCFTLTCPI
jgi:hypothetical protein